MNKSGIAHRNSNTIQMLRGLAIIAVVFIHNTPLGMYQVLCRPFLNFSVGMFLFLSGVLSSAENWNPIKRIKKVLIPYIMWTALYTILHNFNNPSVIPAAFFKGLLLGNSAGMMYYIWVYCEFTLLIPLIGRLARSKLRWIGFLISPVEIILMRLLPIILGLQLPVVITIIMNISFVGWFIYFYLGYLLGNHIIKMPNINLYPLLLLSVALQIAEGYAYYKCGIENCGTQLKLSSILTGSVVMFFAYKMIVSDKENKILFLRYLGDASFGIYFAHMAVIFVLKKIPYYNAYMKYPINAIAVLVVSYFVVIAGKCIFRKNSKYIAF